MSLAFLLTTGAVQARENTAELYRRGARLALDGQIDAAIPIFKKVIELSPYYSLGHYGLGKAYLYKFGMLDQAVVHLRKAVELDRRLARGYFYLGMAYFLSKKYPQAATAFKTAYRLDDSYIEALYNLGVIYETIERTYHSGLYYRKYIEEKKKEEEDLAF